LQGASLKTQTGRMVTRFEVLLSRFLLVAPLPFLASY